MTPKKQNEFPLLKRSIHGKKIVYLDSAATTQKPKRVLQKMMGYYEKHNANVHRAIHTLSEESTREYESARETIASFLHAEPEEIIFVKNATDGLNTTVMLLEDYVKEDELIVTSILEHHSNLLPWQHLAKKKNVRIEYVQIRKDGSIDMDHAISLLRKKPKILAITHMSNALGTVVPIKELTKKAHEQGTLVVVDGAQSIAHMPIDVRALDVDFFAFSGHKVYGPMGIGVLYGKKELLQKLEPVFFGGEMIKEVTLERATWNDLPWKFEAGTPPVEGAVGLAEAIRFVEEKGRAKIEAHEMMLTKYALEKMSKIRNIKTYGPSIRGPIIAFSVGDIHPHDVATILDQEGIAIRSGHMCAQPLIETLGVHAVCRVSFAVYNTKKDVDKLCKALEKCIKVFRA